VVVGDHTDTEDQTHAMVDITNTVDPQRGTEDSASSKQ